MFQLQGNRAELLEKIEDGLNRKCYAALRDLLLPMEAADIAGVCTELGENQKIRLLATGPVKAGDALYAVDTYEG